MNRRGRSTQQRKRERSQTQYKEKTKMTRDRRINWKKGGGGDASKPEESKMGGRGLHRRKEPGSSILTRGVANEIQDTTQHHSKGTVRGRA